jgi:hypothetical protein
MTDQIELFKKYFAETFTFKHLYKSNVKYEKQYENKTVIVELLIDYRSDLGLTESLNCLNHECEIIKITEMLSLPREKETENKVLQIGVVVTFCRCKGKTGSYTDSSKGTEYCKDCDGVKA